MSGASSGTLHDMQVRIEDASPATLAGWLHVHNTLIPNVQLSEADARVRLREHRLLVAVVDGEVIGSTTMRPPVDGSDTATVIARVLPAYQGRGIGRALYDRALAQATEAGARRIRTCVLARNEDGVAFARKLGFVEVDRYVLEGDDEPFVDLELG